MNKFLSVVMSLAMLLGAAWGACAQTDSTQITIERNHEDIGTFSPEPFPSGTLALPRHLPMKQYNPDGKGTWDVDRPLTVYEILERNRQLILTRMIQEDPTPEFLKDIQDNHPLWGGNTDESSRSAQHRRPLWQYGHAGDTGQCRRTSYVR